MAEQASVIAAHDNHFPRNDACKTTLSTILEMPSLTISSTSSLLSRVPSSLASHLEDIEGSEAVVTEAYIDIPATITESVVLGFKVHTVGVFLLLYKGSDDATNALEVANAAAASHACVDMSIDDAMFLLLSHKVSNAGVILLLCDGNVANATAIKNTDTAEAVDVAVAVASLRKVDKRYGYKDVRRQVNGGFVKVLYFVANHARGPSIQNMATCSSTLLSSLPSLERWSMSFLMTFLKTALTLFSKAYFCFLSSIMALQQAFYLTTMHDDPHDVEAIALYLCVDPPHHDAEQGHHHTDHKHLIARIHVVNVQVPPLLDYLHFLHVVNAMGESPALAVTEDVLARMQGPLHTLHTERS